MGCRLVPEKRIFVIPRIVSDSTSYLLCPDQENPAIFVPPYLSFDLPEGQGIFEYLSSAKTDFKTAGYLVLSSYGIKANLKETAEAGALEKGREGLCMLADASTYDNPDIREFTAEQITEYAANRIPDWVPKIMKRMRLIGTKL